MSSPGLLQVVRLHLLHTRAARFSSRELPMFSHQTQMMSHHQRGPCLTRSLLCFFLFMASQSLRVKRNTHAQAISATTLLWRNMEVVTSILITMTSQVLLPLCLCEGLLRCRQVAVGSLRPSVMTGEGSWPTLSYCWGPTMRLRRKHRCSDALLVSSCEQLSRELENDKSFKGYKRRNQMVCVFTWNQHGGDDLRGLQEVHVPPLEGLTVVGLQVAVHELDLKVISLWKPAKSCHEVMFHETLSGGSSRMH